MRTKNQLVRALLIAFVNSYIETAKWVEECTKTTSTKDTIAKAFEDSMEFITRVEEEFGEDKANEIMSTVGADLGSLAGHCFLLDRNGHGSGFWDRPEMWGGDQDVADKLAEIARSFPTVNCYSKKNKFHMY